MAYILVRMRVGAFSACDASVNQCQGFHDLRVFAKHDEAVSSAILDRMNSRHLWYVSQEFVPVSLVSRRLDPVEKRKVADAILSQPKGHLFMGAIKMPHLTDTTELQDRVGPNSRHFLDALSIDTNFLRESVDDWPKIPAFLKFESFVLNMPITNDESERLVRRTVRYANLSGRGEAEFQGQLQLNGDALARVPCRYKKA